MRLKALFFHNEASSEKNAPVTVNLNPREIQELAKIFRRVYCIAPGC
jgi:hypothetical protein